MKKFSITRLEDARMNPLAFANSLKSSTASENHVRYSKYSLWRNIIFGFHQHNDINKSINDFQNKFMLRFMDNRKNQQDMEEYICQIQNYGLEFHKRNLIFIEQKKRIDIKLSDALKIGGELSIICMNNNFGYTTYFLSKTSDCWEEELRFPIIQNYLSEIVYGVDSSDVEVGVYALDKGCLLLKTYSKEEILEALAELRTITTMMLSTL